MFFRKSFVFSMALVLVVVTGTAIVQGQQAPILNNPSTVEHESYPEVDPNLDVQPAGNQGGEWASRVGDSPVDSMPADSTVHPDDVISGLVSRGVESVSTRDGTATTLKAAVIFGALSLAPAILLMTTCYIRIVVVLGLLRQAFGAQQLPPTQVLTALSVFITILVMAPVWNQVKTDAIDPYTAEGSEMSWDEAWAAGVRPVKDFMSQQIERAGNQQAVAIFYKYAPKGVSPGQQAVPPKSYSEVPLNVILPAFVLSELKVAFLLGFQIYLPFLVLDLVVSSVTVSMGMLMLPPTMVSFPLKLILFVMVDGWNLVVGMLLQSFGSFG